MTGPDGGEGLDQARWEQIARIFDRAAELPVEAQPAFVVAEAGDHRVAEAVLRMLAADRAEDGILGKGIAPVAHLGLEPEAPLLPGARVGAFDVIGEIGRGGMGVVYGAVDRHLGRPAALKFLPRSPAGTGALGGATGGATLGGTTRGGTLGGAEQLIAEAKAASALDHPNVATVYQVGETEDGRRFIAMARYEGETLRARLARGPLPAAEALAIARQVAAGLAAAHRAGIIHRDVTPANIFLTSDGPVKLLDFGIAALTSAAPRVGIVAGTLSSMSPEQARGEATDARTDVWALGAVLYRMLTGEPPFAGADSVQVLDAIRDDSPAPQLHGRRGVPARLARVIDRALQKDPERRYGDAGELLAALDGVASRPRRRWLAGAAVAVVMGAVAAPVVWPRGGDEPAARRREMSTLAVLPPRESDGDSANRYLAEGVAGELTSRLAKLRRLRVKGPRAAGAIDAAATSPQALGAALGVDLLVESRVGRRDSLVFVTLRLVDAREGFQLWGDDYLVPATDLLALQDSIARDVAVAVAGELSAGERAALEARVTASPAAYDHYLRGNYLTLKRTPAAVREAMDEYAAAARLDPRFAEAHAQAAYARSLYVDWGWAHPGRTRGDLVREAEALVDRAIELDPRSPVTWLASAYLRVARDPYHHEGAVTAFETSLALDSLNPEAFHQYGQTLMALGRYPEAVRAYLRVLELDPARPMTLVPLAAIAIQRGNAEEAMRWADSAVAVTRNVPAPYALAVRAHIAARMGKLDDALRTARRALDLDDSYPPPALSVVTIAHHRLGDSAAAGEALEQLLASIDLEHPTPTDVRFVSSALFTLGRTDEALRLIERAAPRGAQLWFYLQSSDFNPWRDHPRFRAIETEADPR